MLVTRTGWTLQYIDGLCLRRALELIEYWVKEAKAQLRATKRAQGVKDFDYAEPSDWRPLTEEEAFAQMGGLPKAGPDQIGIDGESSRMPEELRDMVRWAEGKKQEWGIN